MSIKLKLPQVVILYGPPAAGKGTQANYLKKILPDYYHLDFGTQLRKFIEEHLGNYSKEVLIENPNSTAEQISVAKSLRQDMLASLPAKNEDLMYVVEKAITDNINEGRGMIVEGPGRNVQEALQLSDYFKKHDVEVSIFHLHLNIEEAIRRSTKRYYIPNSKASYKSYESAKADCLPDQEPYQRPEDTDSSSITTRYRLMYSDHFAQIIGIYQLNSLALVFTLDANKSVEKVSEDISKYLKEFFGYNS